MNGVECYRRQLELRGQLGFARGFAACGIGILACQAFGWSITVNSGLALLAFAAAHWGVSVWAHGAK